MRKIVTLIMISVTFGLSAQRGGVQEFHWRERPAGEMPAAKDAFMSLEKGRILCYLSNDESFYYVDMIIPDFTIQKMILDAGMNIWFDTDGKKRKEVALRYPVGANNVRAQLRSKGERRTENESRILMTDRPLPMAYEISFAGFGDDGPRRNVNAAENEQYRASVYYNEEGELLYSLRLPKEIITIQEAKRGRSQPFSIGIEYGSGRAVPNVTPPAPAGARPGSGPGVRGGGSSTAQIPGLPPAKIAWVRGLLPAER